MSFKDIGAIQSGGNDRGAIEASTTSTIDVSSLSNSVVAHLSVTKKNIVFNGAFNGVNNITSPSLIINTATTNNTDNLPLNQNSTINSNNTEAINIRSRTLSSQSVNVIFSGATVVLSSGVFDIISRNKLSFDKITPCLISEVVSRFGYYDVVSRRGLRKEISSVINNVTKITPTGKINVIFSGGVGVDSFAYSPILILNKEYSYLQNGIINSNRGNVISFIGVLNNASIPSNIVTNVSSSSTLNAAQNSLVVFSGGIEVNSFSEMQINFISEIISKTPFDITSTSIAVSRGLFSSIIKNKVEIDNKSMACVLAAIGADSNLINNVSSIIVADSVTTISITNEEDVVFVEGDVDVWVLNSRRTTWKLFQHNNNFWR